jgi:hypothetical protein
MESAPWTSTHIEDDTRKAATAQRWLPPLPDALGGPARVRQRRPRGERVSDRFSLGAPKHVAFVVMLLQAQAAISSAMSIAIGVAKRERLDAPSRTS